MYRDTIEGKAIKTAVEALIYTDATVNSIEACKAIIENTDTESVKERIVKATEDIVAEANSLASSAIAIAGNFLDKIGTKSRKPVSESDLEKLEDTKEGAYTAMFMALDAVKKADEILKDSE